MVPLLATRRMSEYVILDNPNWVFIVKVVRDITCCSEFYFLLLSAAKMIKPKCYTYEYVLCNQIFTNGACKIKICCKRN